ncbi:hypothetical protein LCGC14_1550100 [marine sediment metagenome]|uniref:Uncharacterized protein n=1 Tax=marine sediment metagenome TaxID=412755 RepID=A0A0F9IQH1_9ZZZZ
MRNPLEMPYFKKPLSKVLRFQFFKREYDDSSSARLNMEVIFLGIFIGILTLIHYL